MKLVHDYDEELFKVQVRKYLREKFSMDEDALFEFLESKGYYWLAFAKIAKRDSASPLQIAKKIYNLSKGNIK